MPIKRNGWMPLYEYGSRMIVYRRTHPRNPYEFGEISLRSQTWSQWLANPTVPDVPHRNMLRHLLARLISNGTAGKIAQQIANQINCELYKYRNQWQIKDGVPTMYDKTLCNPTQADVLKTVEEAELFANQASRAMTVSCDRDIVQAVHKKSYGTYQTDGGGVANSYGYKAQSSRLAVLWYTDKSGRKYVRVKSDRVSISGRHVTYLLGRDPVACFATVVNDRGPLLEPARRLRDYKRLCRALGSQSVTQRGYVLVQAHSGAALVRYNGTCAVLRVDAAGRLHEACVAAKYCNPERKTFQRLTKSGKLLEVAFQDGFGIPIEQSDVALSLMDIHDRQYS